MRKAILVLAIIGGAVAALGALVLGSGLVVLSALAGEMGGGLLVATLALAVVVAGIGLGALAGVNGGQALAGRPGARLRVPRWGWWLLAFAGVVAGGQALFSAGVEPVVPLFHVVAAAVPPLLYLALAAGAARQGERLAIYHGRHGAHGKAETVVLATEGSLSGMEPPRTLGGGVQPKAALSRTVPVPARSTWGSLAWGGLGGVGLGFLIEGLALVVVVLIGSAVISMLRPDLLTELQTWAEEMQRSGVLDADALQQLLSPVVILAALLFASVFVPLVEEVAKALAVPIVALTGRRLTRLDGFLLGVAAGAGFALVEGMLNGALGLSDASGWAVTMLSRAGAAAMHCLASGLFGLAWQAWLTERRLGRGLALAATSVGLHGLWNAAALGIGVSGLLRPTVGFGALSLRDVQAVAIVGLLVALWLLAVATLAWLPRRLAEEASFD